MALGITIFLGLFFLIGILIIHFTKHAELVEHISIAIASGAMLALLFLDLLPDVVETFSGKMYVVAVIFIMLGLLFLVGLDHFIPEHNEGGEEETAENMIHIGLISAIAIILHNIVEGMTVYSIAMTSIASGLSMAIGVGLHNIPMGMLISSTLTGERRSKRYLILFFSCISTFIGGLLMMLIEPVLTETLVGLLVCIALGMVLYILFFELLPSMRHFHGKYIKWISAAVGFALVLVSAFLE